MDEYLAQEEQETAAWQAQWKDALEATAGIAPYLEQGDEYVEDLRRVDAKRLSELDA